MKMYIIGGRTFRKPPYFVLPDRKPLSFSDSTEIAFMEERISQ